MDKKRQDLLNSIRMDIKEYWDIYSATLYDPNDPKIPLHSPTFGPDEVMSMIEVMLSTQVTMGKKVFDFESEIGNYFGVSEVVTANSGSSANLLAIAALANPATSDGLKSGDEVIVPALSWSTTVWPLIQHNLVPVFVDINPETLNVDPQSIEEAISSKTRAVMIVPVYGNPCEMYEIVEICKRRGLQLIEDNCESIGAYYDHKPLGTFGRIATYSFYFSHHITTLEGGACISKDFGLAETIRILRGHGWVRDTKNPQMYLQAYPDIDPLFLFVNLGYNMRLTELQGAIGSLQLPKLNGFIKNRRDAAYKLLKGLGQFSSVIGFQKESERGVSSCFGFPITILDKAPFTVRELRSHLQDHGIETRPIICGNIAKQPAIQLYPYRIEGNLEHASRVMTNGFAIPCHQSMSKLACNHIIDVFQSFMSERGVT